MEFRDAGKVTSRKITLSDGIRTVVVDVTGEELKKIQSDPDYAHEYFKAETESSASGTIEAKHEPLDEDEADDFTDSDFNEEAIFSLTELMGKGLETYSVGSKMKLYNQVQRDMAARGFEIDRPKIRRKWNSLLHHYNWINSRLDSLPKPIKWPYFEVLDVIVKKNDGSLSSLKPPGLIASHTNGKDESVASPPSTSVEASVTEERKSTKSRPATSKPASFTLQLYREEANKRMSLLQEFVSQMNTKEEKAQAHIRQERVQLNRLAGTLQNLASSYENMIDQHEKIIAQNEEIIQQQRELMHIICEK